jgi:FAS-associated factor 2
MMGFLTGMLFGPEQLGGTASARRFVQKFEADYGTVHPCFIQDSYKAAIDRAKTEGKFLLVYLHSEEHEDTPTFCRWIVALQHTTCSPFFTQKCHLQ